VPTINSCPYQAGQRIEETYPLLPHGTAIPIDHIVVVMQENRSFDHYFQKLPEYGQPEVAVAPDNASMRDQNGKKVTFSRADTLCLDDASHEGGF
jgi:phospholipase C